MFIRVAHALFRIMKTALLIIAFVILPLIVGFFQNLQYEFSLKEKLQDKALSIVNENKVKKARVDFEKLNLSIAGEVETLEDKERVVHQLSKVGRDGLVRIRHDNNRLKAYGTVRIEKKGNYLNLSGKVRQRKSSLILFNAIPGFVIRDQDELEEDQGYMDSPLLVSPVFKSWLVDYLTLSGDRCVTVTAKNQQVHLEGTITEAIFKDFKARAAIGQFDLVSGSNFTKAYSVKTKITKKRGVTTMTGFTPSAIDPQRFPFITELRMEVKPLASTSPLLEKEECLEWLSNALSAEGNRSITLIDNLVKIEGEVTLFQSELWQSRLNNLGVALDSSKLVYKPSIYHFDSYNEPQKSEPVEKLAKLFKQHLVYYPEKSKDFFPVEYEKIEKIVDGIKELTTDEDFIIGAHWNGMENKKHEVAIGRQRCRAVIDALELRGIDRSRFKIISFSRSSSTLKQTDYKNTVEILIK